MTTHVRSVIYSW